MKSSIPDNIDEEYYQISEDILSSFPKYRPPLDLFELKEELAVLQPYIRKGQRLSNQQVEEVAGLCKEGNLFVSRSDHPIYSKHIVKQLDLVLVDANLKEAEVGDIFVRALTARVEEFLEQPVQAVFDKLYHDLMVLTEYLATDPPKIKALLRRLHKEHSLANHSANTGIVGLWLYIRSRQGHINRKDFDRVCIGLFIHDLGMSKVPSFIRTKTVPLTGDDKQKVNLHPLAGGKIAHKLGLTFDEVVACLMEHHERLDGSGYPQKKTGDQISKVGALCAVADSFAAMVSERPYAQAMEPLAAATELAKDTRRYDAKLARLLQTAYSTGDFF